MKKTGRIKSDNIREIFAVSAEKAVKLPLYQERISAGFPSPADDYVESKLDLNEYLVLHPAATFFIRVKGDSMVRAGIDSGDMLIVDRSIGSADGKIVVAVLNGEFTVKRLSVRKGRYFLVPENEGYQEIEIKGEDQFEIWGVVTKIIKDAV